MYQLTLYLLLAREPIAPCLPPPALPLLAAVSVCSLRAAVRVVPPRPPPRPRPLSMAQPCTENSS